MSTPLLEVSSRRCYSDSGNFNDDNNNNNHDERQRQLVSSSFLPRSKQYHRPQQNRKKNTGFYRASSRTRRRPSLPHDSVLLTGRKRTASLVIPSTITSVFRDHHVHEQLDTDKNKSSCNDNDDAMNASNNGKPKKRAPLFASSSTEHPPALGLNHRSRSLPTYKARMETKPLFWFRSDQEKRNHSQRKTTTSASSTSSVGSTTTTTTTTSSSSHASTSASPTGVTCATLLPRFLMNHHQPCTSYAPLESRNSNNSYKLDRLKIPILDGDDGMNCLSSSSFSTLAAVLPRRDDADYSTTSSTLSGLAGTHLQQHEHMQEEEVWMFYRSDDDDDDEVDGVDVDDDDDDGVLRGLAFLRDGDCDDQEDEEHDRE